MITIKKKFKKEDVESEFIARIVKKYSHKDKVRIAFYIVEKYNNYYVDVLRKWLVGNVSLRKLHKEINHHHTNHAVLNALYCACFPSESTLYLEHTLSHTTKHNEYFSYARLFAYEDLDFQHKKLAKTFNLDNDTDLNIFLDFLTDNYPTAITFKREEYFTKRFPREYLKLIYA